MELIKQWSIDIDMLLLCFNGLTMICLRDARLLCIMTQNIKKEGSEHPTFQVVYSEPWSLQPCLWYQSTP